MSGKVLVTGVTGYIGAHAAKALVDAGYTVRGTVRNLADDTKNEFLRRIIPSEKLEIVQADLLDEQEVWNKVVAGCQYVAHIAAPLADPRQVEDTDQTMIQPALKGTKAVLEASKNAGVKRFIQLSSIFACSDDFTEDVITHEMYNETASVDANAYGYMKVTTERLAFEYDSPSMRVVSLNPGFVVGPPLGPRFPDALEAPVLVPLRGNRSPNFTFGFVDIQDVNVAIIKVLEAENPVGRFILVDRTVSIRYIIKMFKEKLPALLKSEGLDPKKVDKVKTFLAPKSLMIALAKHAPVFLTKDLGTRRGDRLWIVKLIGNEQTKYETSRVQEQLNMHCRNVDEGILQSAIWCVKNGFI